MSEAENEYKIEFAKPEKEPKGPIERLDRIERAVTVLLNIAAGNISAEAGQAEAEGIISNDDWGSP